MIDTPCSSHVMTSNSGILPLEICETVLDYLPTRSTELCRCALACRAFAIHAQSRLFRTISIPTSQSTDPHPLLQIFRSSPSVSGYVQSMSIGLRPNNDVFASLAECSLGWPRLRTLVLYPVFSSPEVHENIYAILLGAPTLHQLDIFFASPIDGNATIYPILRCCSESLQVLGLHTLSLTGFYSEPRTPGPPRDLATYPKLQELVIADSWYLSTILMFAQTGCPLDLSNLRTLRYTSRSLSSSKLTSSLNRVLQKTTSLRHLHINVSDDVIEKLDLSAHRLLSHIETDQHSNIAAILARLPESNCLTAITIQTSILVDDWAQGDHRSNREVSNRLPRYAARLQEVIVGEKPSRFPRLERVVLKIKPYDEDDRLPVTLRDMKRQLEEAFWKLHRRGLLLVQYPGDGLV
ncbi:hypothetical protein MIND_01226500 [Mycena indigotica]|uniref:F-box domain-containing protein n=1 Tax=Mycena indigotica TaxID=2126181 RepID=A0A8H6VVU9_9AGAR|nr:uncharacterized protein MIND_01226500 [Mycena indigotica]KAF7292008.1 hypothetical protein MIND_01226500 [Mycena indigotica]